MKKLLILLCASAFVISACSSTGEPTDSVNAKHKCKKHTSGINYNK